jgi:hypothetical protein
MRDKERIVAQENAPVKQQESKKSQEVAPPDALEFSNSVYGWLRKADRDLAVFQEQMTDPVLAVDAHLLQALARIRAELDQASANLELHIPPEKREGMIKKAS